ncbi:putative transmembrane protein [Toxoplasma gondii TgCatPRC2]|uniref:Transmembrane protein n=2 Tax=Toxoplasma gondii TaxID=5811 RepID=A0A139XX65_TOXGO|nr:hypothetical protein TGARI_227380 [Toxoplasma gondii ARI]KYK65009.1 putative transmembrane protein [Toxoplasma gondii TgCatPRC2]
MMTPECGDSPAWSHSISGNASINGDPSCVDAATGEDPTELRCYYIDVAFDCVSEVNTTSTETKMLSKLWGDESFSVSEADGRADLPAPKQKPSSEIVSLKRQERVSRVARRLYVHLPRLVRSPMTRLQKKTEKRVVASLPSLARSESVVTADSTGEASCRRLSSVGGALSASGSSLKRSCSRGRSQAGGKVCSCESIFGVFTLRVFLAACILMLALLIQLVLLVLARNLPFAHHSKGSEVAAVVSEQGTAKVGEFAQLSRAAQPHELSGEDTAVSSSFITLPESGFRDVERDGLGTTSRFHRAEPAPRSVFACNVAFLIFLFCSVLRMYFLTPNLASAVTIRFFLCVSVAFLFRGLSCLLSALSNHSAVENRETQKDFFPHIVLEATGLWIFGGEAGSPVTSQKLVLWILVSFWGYYTSKHVILAYIVIPLVAVIVCVIPATAACDLPGHAAATLFISSVCIIYHLLLDIAAQRYLRTQSFRPSGGSIAAFCGRYVVGDVLIRVLAFLEALHLRLEGVMCVSSPTVVAHVKLPDRAEEESVSTPHSTPHSLTYEDLASRVVLAYAGSGDFDATNCRRAFLCLLKKVKAIGEQERCRESGGEIPTAAECEMEVFAASHAYRSNVNASLELGESGLYLSTSVRLGCAFRLARVFLRTGICFTPMAASPREETFYDDGLSGMPLLPRRTFLVENRRREDVCVPVCRFVTRMQVSRISKL